MSGIYEQLRSAAEELLDMIDMAAEELQREPEAAEEEEDGADEQLIRSVDRALGRLARQERYTL